MGRFSIAVTCLLLICVLSMAQQLPTINIEANAFEAIQIVSKLKGVKAKIVITSRKMKSFAFLGKGEEAKVEMLANMGKFAETYADVIVAIQYEMAKKNPKMLKRLKDVASVPEGKRMNATMTVLEEYMGIKADSQFFFERAEKVYWEWLKRDKRITILKKKKK